MGQGETIVGQLAKISERVRLWREAAGLTLQDLARRSELATSTVQKVETGQMVPSVAVLLKLSRGLGRPAAEFVQDAELDLDAQHLRQRERSRIDGIGGADFERLSADLSAPALEMWRVRLAPGASSGAGTAGWEGEAMVVCENGRVAFVLGDRHYELEAGDSFHFKATSLQEWRNDGAVPALFTITGTLPRQFRALIQRRIAAIARRKAS